MNLWNNVALVLHCCMAYAQANVVVLRKNIVWTVDGDGCTVNR